MYKLVILFNTVKYLRFTQIYFRLYYLVRKNLHKILRFNYPLSVISYSKSLSLNSSLQAEVMNKANKFTFLNLSYKFNHRINWNYSNFGKLWTYNLTYFEYLNQKGISQEEGLELINNFIDQIKSIDDGMESYPISLRNINWIKFLTYHQVKEQKINDVLYAQYAILMNNLEYHLLGNHLLENAFSLLFGAYYFQDEKLYAKAEKILIAELEEQILNDGAHFELSPMYHQIILFRVLDCINLIQNNIWKEENLLECLIKKAELMLGWLNTITFENGDIPLLNDSAKYIAPTTQELNEYASSLKIEMKNLKLSDCGYRKIENKYYEMVIDVGNIGPDYIPGHAHSDTFSFELYIEGRPIIVDTGLSTYETNIRRTLERSTMSHNTVEIDGINQSEVWAGFRVARRAKIIHLKEGENWIEGIHDGYKRRLNALHQRKFLFDNDKIRIIDSIISEKKYSAIARLHFYPGIKPIVMNDGIQIDNVVIKLQDIKFKINNYNYAPEFNILKEAKMLEMFFTKKLEIEIIL